MSNNLFKNKFLLNRITQYFLGYPMLIRSHHDVSSDDLNHEKIIFYRLFSHLHLSIKIAFFISYRYNIRFKSRTQIQGSLMKHYFFTGAGLSKESGIKTFRDTNDGTWVNYDLNKVCNFSTYKQNLSLVFDFYSGRKDEVLKSTPNPAHDFLANLQKELGQDNLTIFTQNIDNLLERAGCKNVIHLHGNLHEMKCYGCGHVWNIGEDPYTSHRKCPRCDCVKAIKPNVVFFNERAPEYAKLKIMSKTIQSEDSLIAIGTSFNVIREEDIIPRKRIGSPNNVQINPELTNTRYWGINLQLTATEGLLHLKKQNFFK